MLPVLLTIFLAAPPADPDAVRLAVALKGLDDWHSGRKYVGMTPQQMLKELGNPTSAASDTWEYRERHVGDYLFVWVRVVTFENGVVVAAPRVERPVGCIYYKPRR
jgi:hypothetical protein